MCEFVMSHSSLSPWSVCQPQLQCTVWTTIDNPGCLIGEILCLIPGFSRSRVLGRKLMYYNVIEVCDLKEEKWGKKASGVRKEGEPLNVTYCLIHRTDLKWAVYVESQTVHAAGEKQWTYSWGIYSHALLSAWWSWADSHALAWTGKPWGRNQKEHS